MVEFILLGTPAVLLTVSCLAVFVNSYVDTVARSIAIDASRNAALADQDYYSANSYLTDKLKRLLPLVSTTTALQLGNYASVDIGYQPLATLFNPLPMAVHIKVVTPLEALG